jgi:hypothetical protein
MTRVFHDDCRGICLAEVLIALAAGAVALTAALQSLDHFQRRLSGQHEAAGQVQDLRIGLRVVEDELRLAWTGSRTADPSVRVATEETVEFVANLNGLVTTLAAPVASTQQDLPVMNGSGWPKGKQVAICDREQCATGQLARDGRKGTLTLTGTAGRSFPEGSEIRVLNTVRYYLRTDRGATTLMRSVDGGANPLIGNMARLRLAYFDRQGRRVADPRSIARVRVEASVRAHPHVHVREVGLRGRA